MYRVIYILLGYCAITLNAYSPTTSFPILNSPKNPLETIKLIKLYVNNGNINNNGEKLYLQTALQESHIVFDVGANQGDWSNLVYTSKPGITIYAFEPFPHTYKNLCKNIQNPKFYPVNAALSDSFGNMTFYSYEDSTLNGFYDRAILKDKFHFTSSPITVLCDTLDHFCHEHKISKIDFLKIDTEGAEWKVLQGAQNLLKDQKIRNIQFEYGGCYQDAKTTLYQVCDFLTKNGYAIFFITPKGLLHLAQWDDSFENYEYSNFAAIIQKEVNSYPLMQLKK
jgi:FkbM family methyltransferase